MFTPLRVYIIKSLEAQRADLVLENDGNILSYIYLYIRVYIQLGVYILVGNHL